MTMKPRPSLLLFAFLSVSPTVRLYCQEAGDRAAIQALRDSLAGVSDSVALKRLEARTIDVARRDRDNTLLHLRLGFVAYRLGEIGDSKSHYDDAAGEFEWASELKPDWPYAWYGLGLAELAQGEHSVIGIENLRQQLGTDYLSKAARAFAHAVQADPAFARATIDLATTALTQRIRQQLDVALEAVRLAAASPAGRDPGVQLARGRIEREVGEADSALSGFEKYLAVGGDSGVGLYELARTYYWARRPADGRRTYFAGARTGESRDAMALYRRDLGYVAESADLAAYDALATPAARATWLERFWDRRDVEEAREPGERLAEHFRRWFYAWRNFRLVSRHRRYDITEVYRSDQQEFDDRGIIYLRHGEPDRRAYYTGAGTVGTQLQPNESWLYRRPEGNLIFHFVAREKVQDYKLVESVLDALGWTSRFQRDVNAADYAGLWESRANLDPSYTRIGPRSATEERERGRQAITLGTTTDSYRQHFPVTLDLVVHDFVMGERTTGERAGQELHVVFAVPAEELAPQPGRGGDQVLYPLHFRLLVADASDSVVARLDTLRVFAAPRPLRGAAYLTGRLAVPVPTGLYHYRVLVTTGDRDAGQILGRDSLAVEPLDGRQFAASDVVVGRAGSGLTWALQDDTVLLNPLDRFPEGEVAELYYEVYGLSRGAAYHTEVRLQKLGGSSLFGAIRRLFGGSRSPVLLAFDAVADGPVTRVHRGVDLRGVGRGEYLLTLRLTDPAKGREIARTRRFQVVARQ
jgi:GWxTD domain-containing protein